ncbi:helix-turn-helix domain-containing protein [Micromonospora trifolii]|nr:AraC family transcriptional regulator [Micromonospora trifolii]
MVSSVVDTIRTRYSEPLRLDDLASAAFVSKFHLLRTFHKQTNITPGRFLAAVRLQEAKRMLYVTSLNVANIATQVGYSSTGSFTRRFTDAVGLSPIRYRRMSRGQRFDFTHTGRSASWCEGARVTGVVSTPHPIASPIFVGAFDSPILQGEPRASTLLAEPGPFEICGLPCGRWYFHAVALRPGETAPSELDPEAPMLAGCVGPVLHIDRGLRKVPSDLVLTPPEPTDPPILFARLGLAPAADAHSDDQR